jgi:hypothetical protein
MSNSLKISNKKDRVLNAFIEKLFEDECISGFAMTLTRTEDKIIAHYFATNPMEIGTLLDIAEEDRYFILTRDQDDE